MRLFQLLTCLTLLPPAWGADHAELKFFETEIRPLLAGQCYECHGPKKAKQGLRVDHIEHLRHGGQSGPALEPGNPADSLLIQVIRGAHPKLKQMPPKKTLSPAQITRLEQWIARGAFWPEETPAHSEVDANGFTREDKKWWAIQPVRTPQPPEAGQGWARNEIDRFVARRLDDAGLRPADEADRIELIRRATFDLHGLPPTPEQIENFVKDHRPDAWRRLVRNLLASPRYGERWAQHWLDVVRFAESDGYNEDAFRPSAGTYRDYVIRSLNDDKPYDRFVREHLAGDEMDPDNPDVLIGTAFLRHGIYEWNQRNVRMHWDLIINELTRATGEAFLGISIGCAQCHDHKFDPILQKDYFSLQAFLSSVRWPIQADLATPDKKAEHSRQQRRWEETTQAIRDEMLDLVKDSFNGKLKYTIEQFPPDIQDIYHKPDNEKTTYEKQLSYLVYRQVHRATNRFDYAKTLKSKPDKLKRYRDLETELKKFDSMKPEPLPDAFIATDFGPLPARTWLQTRTSRTEIQPAFLTLLNEQSPRITATGDTTGRRLALANWIASEKNPFTARVIVNRIWQRHFGRGIVATPNDFGSMGARPSHPELLDWLTSRFLAGGWKMKGLHELIMDSAVYRQTARREPGEMERLLDPAGALLWRFLPQRLDAEAVRDAMLAVSGELQHREGGPSVSGTSPQRSVYVIKKRNRPDELLSGFDAPLGFESTADRIATTTPIQSLLLVNGSWSVARAAAFAKRLVGNRSEFRRADAHQAYRLAFGRTATEAEVDAAIEFVRRQAGETGPEAPPVKFPDETGLRPVKQHFASVRSPALGRNTLWLQPDSRFERLRLSDLPDLGDEFTIEAVTILDRIYPDASVSTLVSRWNGSTRTPGWNLGITSTKSRYQPRNFIVQLIGNNFQDETIYEVVASNLRLPLNRPVYLAAVVRATTTGKTSGTVTFHMLDLSDPAARLQSVTKDTAVVGQIQNPALQTLIGGRQSSGHLWDGQLARFALSDDALPPEQLLVGGHAKKAKRVLDWTFDGPDGNQPAPNTAWLPPHSRSGLDSAGPMLAPVTDFCHALLNANEFLYLH